MEARLAGEGAQTRSIRRMTMSDNDKAKIKEGTK